EGKRLISAEQLLETKSAQMVLRMDGPLRAHEPETNLLCYGLGWFLQDYRGEFVISHGGGIDGFRAHVALVPKAGLGIAILANQGGNAMPEALKYSLIDQLLG